MFDKQLFTSFLIYYRSLFMGYAWRAKISRHIVWGFFILCLFPVFSTEALAADLTKEGFQKVLGESLKALWIGEEFSPELAKNQAILKSMLEKGAVSKAELKEMMKKEMSPVLNQHKTSYNNLLEMARNVNELFSPALDWTTVKEEIIGKLITDKLQKDNPYEIKFGTLAPEGTPWLEVPYNILVPTIVRLTDGALKFKFYTGGIMGEDPDVLRKMDIGQLDGCGCTAFGVLKASSEAAVFMAPNLFNNYQEVDYVYKKFRKRLDESFAKRGYICAAIIDTGFLYLFSKHKITGLADLRTQKALYSMGNIEATLLNELGVDTIPVAIPEVVSALSTGMADTFIAPPAWALGMQAYQYINYYIKRPFLYAPGVVVVSMNLKDKVARHFGVSETIVNNALELLVMEIYMVEDRWKEDARIYEEKSLKAFESKCGIKPVTLSPEDQKAFEAAAAKVREKLAGKDYPRDFLDDVLSALEEYRTK